VEIIGNGTASIHPNLISATVDRLGDSESYSWNVTAYGINYTDYSGYVTNFILSTSEVNEIAVGLFESINNTEKVGTYGEEPYPGTGDLPNLKWVTELYLENNTVYFLYINMEGLILFKSTNWFGNFEYIAGMYGSDVLLPESAFDDYVQVLSNLFAPHMEA
ncbi:MAG: hypothetical protein ACXABK_04590, partial [Candidatus Heimdallarchaeaceae archaeon]